jgi:DNA-binding NarL/FixJ family response regulator
MAATRVYRPRNSTLAALITVNEPVGGVETMVLCSAPSRDEPLLATDAELEELVLTCLEDLACLAQACGHQTRAARLYDAAGLLRRDELRTPTADELTAREWDVAMRVAQGSSNRQIGLELVVSERTVDTHVSHILNKLGLVSRAQIAAWVVQRHPAHYRASHA